MVSNETCGHKRRAHPTSLHPLLLVKLVIRQLTFLVNPPHSLFRIAEHHYHTLPFFRDFIGDRKIQPSRVGTLFVPTRNEKVNTKTV